jgi:lysophospholipase L1-like esterase
MKPLIPLGLAFAFAAPAAAFEFKDGDRVVLIGSTAIEREQRSGYWETALTARNPDKVITFRNLGWSGDTVWGEARAEFGTAADGYKHLIDHVRAEKPTVILIAYGTNESFAGPDGLPRFREQLKKLLDDLATTKARFVLMSPPKMIKMPLPMPDPAMANQNIQIYGAAIHEEAQRRGATFIDAADWLSAAGPQRTENGLHLTAEGYRATADLLLKALDLPTAEPLPPERAEQLRQAIVAKNELYFHRWRPQNTTYLFGFRKHEQGQNAREIPQFDPLVTAKEQEIAQLRK